MCLLSGQPAWWDFVPLNLSFLLCEMSTIIREVAFSLILGRMRGDNTLWGTFVRKREPHKGRAWVCRVLCCIPRDWTGPNGARQRVLNE